MAYQSIALLLKVRTVATIDSKSAIAIRHYQTGRPILGKLAGTTTLTLIDKKFNLQCRLKLRLTLMSCEKAQEILPDEKIKVRSK